jgi:hypothetical protein
VIPAMLHRAGRRQPILRRYEWWEPCGTLN